MTTPEELAWAAGMFEGEGSVRINVPTKRNRGHLIVDLANTDVEVVAFFQARWPGYMRQVKLAEDRNQRDYYRWRAAAITAATFLNDIIPHLRTARVKQKALLALEFQAQKSKDAAINKTDEYRARQDDYYARMKALNRRGR